MELVAEESRFEKVHIPEGIHNAELVQISDAPDGKYGQRIALDFVIFYSKKEQPVKIGRIFGKKLTPKSQLWEALTAIGAKLETGKKVDLEKFLGSPCRVVVEDYDDSDGKTVSGISKVKEPDEKTTEYLAQAKEAAKLKKGDSDERPVEVEDIEDAPKEQRLSLYFYFKMKRILTSASGKHRANYEIYAVFEVNAKVLKFCEAHDLKQCNFKVEGKAMVNLALKEKYALSALYG